MILFLINLKKEKVSMVCEKCGAQLDEDAAFCTSCGNTVGVQKEKVNENIGVESSKKKAIDVKGIKPFITQIIGLVVGTFIIVIGILRLADSGGGLTSAQFGADFYTYTYSGIASIRSVLGSIEGTISWLIIAIGAAIDVYSLRK